MIDDVNPRVLSLRRCGYRPLPDNDRIGFEIIRHNDEAISILYAGQPDDLVVAGVVKRELLARGKKGAKRFDVDGCRVFVDRKSTALNGELVKVRIYDKPIDLAMVQFPGVVATVEAICARFRRPPAKA